MTLGDSATANIIAIIALIFSIVSAAFTGWQTLEAHRANQYQAQQPDLTIANNVLVANSGDYPVKGPSPGENTQIVINLNHSTVQDVTVFLYNDFSKNQWVESIGDIPGCTEVNVQPQLSSSDQSDSKVSLIDYATSDGLYWQRQYAAFDGKYWTITSSSKPTSRDLLKIMPTADNVNRILIAHRSLIHVPDSECP